MAINCRKACLLFLLDQSYSMEEPLGDSSIRKCDELARTINAWLQSMIARCSRAGAIDDRLDIGVLGYHTDSQANSVIESALLGPLAGRTLASIADIGNNPARMDTVTARLPDEDTGEIIEMPAEMPVWVDPKAEGGTPLCNVLHNAYGILAEWIEAHPGSFPPIVITITDGESQDGDPIPYADALKDLSTDQGSVTLFNCHLSMTAADSIIFPASDEVLPDELARVLFGMSSVLPERAYEYAIEEGFGLEPGARAMVFNANVLALLKFLRIVTRAVPLETPAVAAKITASFGKTPPAPGGTPPPTRPWSPPINSISPQS